MTTLEQTIVEIIDRAQGFIDDDNLKAEAAVQAMEAILEAVQEEGYWRPGYKNGNGNTLLSGQEWEKRFRDELSKFTLYPSSLEKVLIAARKAKGLT